VLSHFIRRVLPPLAPHVEHLWVARGYLSTHSRNLILPDGAVELIINLGDPQTLCAVDDPDKRTVFRRTWISGERTEPILIDEAGYVHLIGVRLRASGGWPFFGIPMREFSGQVIELEDVLGPEITDLRDSLGDQTTDDARFDLLENWLRTRQRPSPTRAVSYALRAIQDGAGPARIGRIAEEIGISHKHLLREFDRCVGLRPKVFSRLCAFQRVIQSVGHRPEVEWADTATKCGYYDQAHLIREFRAFSRLTPAIYLLRRGPFLNYLEV
jgi:AraC-like DNA-binding protein